MGAHCIRSASGIPGGDHPWAVGYVGLQPGGECGPGRCGLDNVEKARS